MSLLSQQPIDAHWGTLPIELVFQVLRHASTKSRQCALNVSLVSKWAQELAREALLYRCLLHDLDNFRYFIDTAICFSGKELPAKRTLRSLLAGPIADCPDLLPTQVSRDRASLVRHLWVIFSSAPGFKFQDHVHVRMLLQLCHNVETLAISSVSLSHFLQNKWEHFALPNSERPSSCIHSQLKHLTIQSPLPPAIVDLEYEKADPSVQIFKQITHLTLVGKHTRTGLPASFKHFSSLTHLAIPLVFPGFENMQHTSILSASMLPYMIGWDLLNHDQIKKIVFIYIMDRQSCRCSGSDEEGHVCDALLAPIVNANLSHRKAYILPIRDEAALEKIWIGARDGQADLWERAEKVFKYACEKHMGTSDV